MYLKLGLAELTRGERPGLLLRQQLERGLLSSHERRQLRRRDRAAAAHRRLVR